MIPREIRVQHVRLVPHPQKPLNFARGVNKGRADLTQGRNSRIFPVESFETLIETVYLDFPFKGPFLSLSWHCLFSVGAHGNPENIQTLVQPRGSPPDRPERRDRSRVPGLEPQVPSPPCHLLRGPGKTSFLTGTRAVFFTRVPVQLILRGTTE